MFGKKTVPLWKITRQIGTSRCSLTSAEQLIWPSFHGKQTMNRRGNLFQSFLMLKTVVNFKAEDL